jgi:hypothetical protein
VILVAKALAETRDMTMGQVENALQENTRCAFGIEADRGNGR